MPDAAAPYPAYGSAFLSDNLQLNCRVVAAPYPTYAHDAAMPDKEAPSGMVILQQRFRRCTEVLRATALSDSAFMKSEKFLLGFVSRCGSTTLEVAFQG